MTAADLRQLEHWAAGRCRWGLMDDARFARATPTSHCPASFIDECLERCTAAWALLPELYLNPSPVWASLTS